ACDGPSRVRGRAALLDRRRERAGPWQTIPEWFSMSAHSERTDELIGDASGACGPIVAEVEAAAAGRRLDQWLAGRLGPDVSRSRVQALIRQGAVSLDGRPLDEG